MSRSIEITSFLLVLLMAGCAVGPTPTVDVPEKLRPAANEKLKMIVPAKGFQIYECRAKKTNASEYEWAFVAPEAGLFDAKGNSIGRHYGGPHWEASDGSKVLGAVKERADAPIPNAIPWLLLTSTSAGPEGTFSKITSIQRLNARGGVAPASGCSAETAGAAARIAYTADYYLFTAK